MAEPLRLKASTVNAAMAKRIASTSHHHHESAKRFDEVATPKRPVQASARTYTGFV